MADNKKYAWLVMITDANNNKFYSMKSNDDGTFTATYGRLQGLEIPSNSPSKVYPMSEWDSIIKSKIKKGYVDRTSHKAEIKLVESKNTKGETVISKDKHVADLFNLLASYAKQQTQATYTVESKNVTQLMIDDAQKSVDSLANITKTFGTKDWSINIFNKELLNLFGIIPRKMARVQDYMITEKMTKEAIEKMIEQEQSNIDSMASQVIQNTADDTTEDTAETTKQITQLEAMGIEAELVTDKTTIDFVTKKAEEHGKRILRIFKVVNKKTQEAFNKHINNADDKKTEIFWHGSRRANWFSIVQSGLRIRPAGAIITGAMWDSAVYFACVADKSMGYTDNGRWVNGGSNGKTYMALYNVHVGKQLIRTTHDSSCYNISKECKSKGFDSVWAKAGAGIVRDEFMIYSEVQSTIKYLVEFN